MELAPSVVTFGIKPSIHNHTSSLRSLLENLGNPPNNDDVHGDPIGDPMM